MAGSVFGFLGVALGAFGAHALKNLLESTGRLDTYETAVKYMFYHALALILVGVLSKEFTSSLLNNAGWAFIIGILIFSGSLFILCFTGIKMMGAITPIGGVAFLVGWFLLLMVFYKA